MKKLLLKSIFVLTAFSSQNLMAQDQTAQFLKAGKENVNSLMTSYMGPFMKGLGLGLTDGWNNNTAKPLGKGGFDLRFNVGACIVPVEDQTYNIKNAFVNTPGSLQWKPTADLASKQSTMFGPSESAKGAMELYGIMKNPLTGLDTSVLISKLQPPPGSGVPYSVTLPSVQLSFGIIKNTEIMLRFVPQVALDKVSIGTWGFGVKHSLKQWIPVINLQKIWDWSAFGSYSAFNSEFAFGNNGLKPDAGAYNPNPVDYSNQKLTMSGYGWSLGTIVSAKLLFFTPYLGVNYSSSNMNLKMEGNFPVSTPNDEISITQPEFTKVSNLKDPVNIEGVVSGFRGNAGVRLKFLLLVIGADYSIGTYNTATLSIGLNLQSIVPFKL
jgi:hypothetical protein